MSASDLQTLLRFLSQDAKVPLATAMSKVRELQNAHLSGPEQLAKTKPANLASIFPDEKVAKQIISAAKRVTKKRAAGEDVAPSPKKKKPDGSIFSKDVVSPEDLEASLILPSSALGDAQLAECTVFTNRAPLVLAFVVTLLKYTMPEQPLSSRLSLAQGYVSTTSRARAVNLGLEKGRSAEDEGFGEGQPLVTIMGKSLRVLRRWGYEWKPKDAQTGNVSPTQAALETSGQPDHDADSQPEDANMEDPALWAIDLEALKKSNTTAPIIATGQSGNYSNLPIYTPQSARAYLFKAFDSNPAGAPQGVQVKGAKKAAEKEKHLGEVLRALDLVYESWAATLTVQELDKRTWGWYVRVRPDVENGVAGWGGKNTLKMVDILSLRRETDEKEPTNSVT